MTENYVHGYDHRDKARLHDQAAALVDLLHSDTTCLITLQREGGGNALIGRQLHPLLAEAGPRAVRVSPRMVYGTRAALTSPRASQGGPSRPWSMASGAPRWQPGLMDPKHFDAGLRDLQRTTEADGGFR